MKELKNKIHEVKRRLVRQNLFIIADKLSLLYISLNGGISSEKLIARIDGLKKAVEHNKSHIYIEDYTYVNDIIEELEGYVIINELTGGFKNEN